MSKTAGKLEKKATGYVPARRRSAPIEDVRELMQETPTIRPNKIHIPVGNVQEELAKLEAATGSGKSAPVKADSFPLVSELSREDMQDAIRLMQEDLAYQESEAAIREERETIKKRLTEIGEKYDAPGLRWGQLATYLTKSEGRRTLDPKLLVENGVPAAVVAAAYKTGKPFTTVKVVDLSALPARKSTLTSSTD